MKKFSLTPSMEVSMIYNLVLSIISLDKTSFHKIGELKKIALTGHTCSIEYDQAVNRIVDLARLASKYKSYKRKLLALANTECWADKTIRAI
jgi:hypothetical protein